ncbi:excinuclease ABC subunit C [Mycoplasmopsis maculosa]|uniref:Excinuclease ABC subunit C n=1 Tax=Mycoplasmopsis maculosa TaxID=114885 RepID=A0A449B3M4_9BACT|nr:GIY-YIG nuclease family protein [Mycoplasmopsis maculosa]VEU75186.1 excinuclease ABC subunit C [Mycoplasmopsis maculosa]
MKEKIIEKIKEVPSSPGIYLWKDKDGNVIYVGKAKNLKSRMSQYFEGSINSYKTHKLVSIISDFDIFLCKTNKEALLLEKKYIEKYNPEYNILLLDDKKYPYLKVELKNTSLSISLNRKISKESKSSNIFYYGPFPAGYGGGIILKLLQREAFFENGFPIKNNDHTFWLNKFNEIKNILSFKDSNYLNTLKEKMTKAAENLQFEIALDIKNSLTYLKKLKEDQIIELSNNSNIDVFVHKIVQDKIFITILFYRFGILINKENLTIPLHINEEEALRYFFEWYYSNKIKPDYFVVNEILQTVKIQLDDNYNFVFPKIGVNKKILDLAYLNLDNYINREFLNYQKDLEIDKKNIDYLSEITTKKPLKNIVLFDNSNLNNSNPVGVAITYTNGIKNKSLYKKFNLEINNSRQSDVEYMRQSSMRFFSKDNLKINYDLVIVDGGLAQINEVEKVLNDYKIDIPVIGFVKNDKHKTKNIIGINKEIIDIKNKDFYNYVSEMQIEVDRFAKSHLRKRHKITSLDGNLLKIKGLGKKYEEKLLYHFKNYANIYDASIEELSKIVPKKLAIEIKNQVKNN